jgi:hypothetical protein
MQESSQLTSVRISFQAYRPGLLFCGFENSDVCIMRWMSRSIFIYKFIIYMICLYERHKICLKFKYKSNLYLFLR